MSDEIKDAMRRHLEGILGRQKAHPVHPRVEVLWNLPYDISRCTIRVGGMIEEVQPEKVAKLVADRNRMIDREKKDPIRYLCEPPEYLAIDLEAVRKRLANPGVQLILWVNGGIRSSKTEFCTRRVSANFWYTEDAWCWGIHETDTTSRSIQQKRVKKFIPHEMDPLSGKWKRDKETSFSYTEGNGFTGSQFYIKWDAHDERGCLDPVRCKPATPCAALMHLGGRFEFRFYGQQEGTMVGQELTCSNEDEKVTPEIIELVDDRLLTRAEDTRAPKFMERMLEAERILLRGDPLPLPLLGAVYHGWQLISFTPKFGWSAACAPFLTAAKKYDFYDPRPMVQVAMQEAINAMPEGARREAKLRELTERPWTLGSVTQVPRFAQPTDARRLVAYLPTYVNKFKGNWPGAVQSVQGKSDEDIRITLFGDVDKNWQSQFPYDSARHVLDWDIVPREGTIFEVADPAPRKPWVIKWYLIDRQGRKWMLQEWPNPNWEIAGHGKPGPWAVPSKTDKLNGDAGPAQKMQLGWGWTQWTRLIWQGRKRLAEKFAESKGGPFTGKVEAKELTWNGKPELTLTGPFVMPRKSVMDKRFASAPSATRGGTSTVIEELWKEENRIDWEPSSSPSIEDGNLFIETALGTDILGIPGLVCTKECVNTQFTWATYTVPENHSDTLSKDEACKDFRDPDAYFLTDEDCRHLDARAGLLSEGFSF